MESAAYKRSGSGARIRHVRGGSTQDRFASQYGLSIATVRNYESDVRDPTADFLAALAADGWNINWLLTGEGPERIGGGFRVAEGDPPPYGEMSQDLSVDHLIVALELAEEVLRGRWLPKRDYAEVLAGLYTMLRQGLPYAEIIEAGRDTWAQGKQDVSRSERDSQGAGTDRPFGAAAGG